MKGDGDGEEKGQGGRRGRRGKEKRRRKGDGEENGEEEKKGRGREEKGGRKVERERRGRENEREEKIDGMLTVISEVMLGVCYRFIEVEELLGQNIS